MAEYVRPSEEHYMQASPAAMANDEIVRRDLFLLLVMFLADEKITKLSQSIKDLNNGSWTTRSCCGLQ